MLKSLYYIIFYLSCVCISFMNNYLLQKTDGLSNFLHLKLLHFFDVSLTYDQTSLISICLTQAMHFSFTLSLNIYSGQIRDEILNRKEPSLTETIKGTAQVNGSQSSVIVACCMPQTVKYIKSLKSVIYCAYHPIQQHYFSIYNTYFLSIGCMLRRKCVSVHSF